MSEPLGRIMQRGFLGGVDNRRQADLLAENQVVDARNGFILRSTLRRRPGCAAAKTIDSGLTSGFYPVWLGMLTFPSKGNRLVALVNVNASSSKVVIWDAGGGDPIVLTGRTLFSDEVEAVVFGERMYILDPTSQPLYWQFGNTQLEHDTNGVRQTPQGSAGAFFQFRGYIVGDPTADLLKFSKLYGNEAVDADEERSGQGGHPDPLVWHEDQAWRLSTGNGKRIIAWHNQMLVVFTDQGIETFEPNNCNALDPTMLQLTTNFGTKSPQSIRACGEDLLFVDLDGHVRSLKTSLTDEAQGVTNLALSDPIADVVNRINLDRLEGVRSVFAFGQYVVGWPVDGAQYANEFWAYDIADRSWMGPWRFADDDAGGAIQFTGLAYGRAKNDTQPRLWGLGLTGTTASLYKMFQGLTDAGTTIPFRFVTRAFDGGIADASKQWQHAEVRFRFLNQATGDANVTIGVRARINEGPWQTLTSLTATPDATPELDDNGSPPIVGTAVIADYADQKIPFNLTGIGRGRTLQLEFTISDATASFEFLGCHVSAVTDPLDMRNT